jgi:iron complex outermembrane receptor protein
VATGYKQGGFAAKATEPFNPNYGPENLTNYEVGWKSNLLNRRVQINADAFYMDYRDYQAGATLVLDDGSKALLTVNAGTATIKGIELETAFLVTPYDQVTFDVTALDAVFTHFYLPNGDGYGVTASSPTDYSGNQLPYAPHLAGRLDYQHTFVLGDSDTLMTDAGVKYSAHYNLDYHNYSSTAQDAYTRTDLSLTWQRHVSGSPTTFSTRLYVRNLENTAVLAGGQGDNKAPGRDFDQYGVHGYYMPPRTYGVQFTASF